ncbi:FAD-dependent oxidoreductase [Actinocorallia lasiicapitis]
MVIIGAGVIGLSTAITLSEMGVPVRLISDQPLTETTSAKAGALWGPYFSPDPRVTPWSRQSLDELEQMSREDDSGVAMVTGLEATRLAIDPAQWVTKLPRFHMVDNGELPTGYVRGWRYRVPIIDMPVHLEYLAGRLSALGVEIEILPQGVRDLTEVADGSAAIVNCTGLRAGELVSDHELHPLWGQLVVLENPGLTTGFFSDYPESDSPTYFICHKDTVVLGGAVLSDRTDLAPDPEIGQSIIDRCAEVQPLLASARLIEHRVGLRPARDSVRLELTEVDGITVIHNYGHGGSGVTLSWGCAAEVAELLQPVLRRHGRSVGERIFRSAPALLQ